MNEKKSNNFNFVKQNFYLKNKISEYFNKKISDKKIDSLFHSNEITQCDRKLYYKSTNSDYLKKYIDIFQNINNIFLKNKWVQIIKKINGVNVIDYNLDFSDSNYNLTGKIDIILSFENKKYIVNIFGVNKNEFENIIKNGAIRKDIVECVVNMWLSEVQNGLLLYENKENGEYEVFEIINYNLIINGIKTKAIKLFNNIIENIVPDRPYKNNNNEECNCCYFKKKCWVLDDKDIHVKY